jgi:hypothetical protein
MAAGRGETEALRRKVDQLRDVLSGLIPTHQPVTFFDQKRDGTIPSCVLAQQVLWNPHARPAVQRKEVWDGGTES